MPFADAATHFLVSSRRRQRRPGTCDRTRQRRRDASRADRPPVRRTSRLPSTASPSRYGDRPRRRPLLEHAGGGARIAAAYQVGGMMKMLDMSVTHSNTRGTVRHTDRPLPAGPGPYRPSAQCDRFGEMADLRGGLGAQDRPQRYHPRLLLPARRRATATSSGQRGASGACRDRPRSAVRPDALHRLSRSTYELLGPPPGGSGRWRTPWPGKEGGDASATRRSPAYQVRRWAASGMGLVPDRLTVHGRGSHTVHAASRRGR